MSSFIPPNDNPVAAVKPQSIVPMLSPKSPEKVNGPANIEKSQQAEGGNSTETDYNTKNLLPRLATDALSAASAAVMVAPLITIIDKYVLLTASHSSLATSNLRAQANLYRRAIMQNASGQAPIAKSLITSLKSFITSPQSLLVSKPFGLIFMLYGGTYLCANTLDTITSTLTHRPANHVTADFNKFAASSTANIGLCLIKDRKFAQLFGTGPPRPVGMPTMTLFALRDCMTIFASFNLPPVLGPHLQKELDKRGWGLIGGQTGAQFLAPAAVQVLSTPMHLLGLDLYNRGDNGKGGKVPWSDRAKMVWKNWGVSTAARVCRIVPAFGVGGVVNAKVRRSGMEYWV